jgi:hypothetical protein
MNVEQERSRSLWMETPPLTLEPLRGDARADVVVIGAGMAGLSTAYELAREGLSVCVLDRGRFGRGQSSRTTAHLSWEIDDYYQCLIRSRGRAEARQFFESQRAAVERIEAICAEAGIDCDFARVDAFFVPARPGDVELLRRELAAAHEVGFTDAQWVEPGEFSWLKDNAIRFPRQARFHPVKYLNGLVRALQAMGAKLFDMTPVTDVAEFEGLVRVRAQNGAVVSARKAVVATNTPIHLRMPVHTKQAPYRTYVIAAPVPKGSAPDALIWDTLDPDYHYVRLQPGETEDMLIVGGEDHRTGQASDAIERIRRLEAWARERNPQMGPVRYAWSGQVYEPYDYAPYIGRSPNCPMIFLVTGDSGEGMTTGAAAGLILRDLVRGRDNPWCEVYHPNRNTGKRLGDYLREQAPVLKDMAEHLRRPEVNSVEQVEPGEGAVVPVKGRKMAVYRDVEGGLHVRSAVCPHAGCVIHWNSFENCWDCPCHGSQFSVDGEPLSGPARDALAEDREAIHELEIERTYVPPRVAPGGRPSPAM